ncbi:MAG: TonB family protein [Candidatus Obscuribacterales bacterium]|nr:TonB family protein [Steroidobacteraceae bacterium]
MQTPSPNKKQSFARYVPVALGGLVVVGVIVGLVVLVYNMMHQPNKPKRQVAQVVQLIRPPPPPDQPPPPPPPPEEKVEEPLEQATPEDSPPEDASAAEQLGLDADGVAGGDGFGLAARKGGRDLVGGSGAFVWYTSMVKDTILDFLSDDEKVRKGNYQVTVRVWLAVDGKVERIKLATTSGNHDLDDAIEKALTRVSKVREAPPIEMPQPVTLRIVSRG